MDERRKLAYKAGIPTGKKGESAARAKLPDGASAGTAFLSRLFAHPDAISSRIERPVPEEYTRHR